MTVANIFRVFWIMKIKNFMRLGVLALGLIFFGTSTTVFASEDLDYTSTIKENYQDVEVQNRLIQKVKNGELLDSNDPYKKHLGLIEIIDPYTQITTYPDGSKKTVTIDFSEATFYDEGGNIIENVDNSQITPFGVIGGNWNTGSGYACVRGATVSDLTWDVKILFKADFCNNQGTYDNINRIYAIDIKAHDWSILDSGTFRETETFQYSAYGGVKAQIRPSKDSKLYTEYVYLRVGNDKYWVDSSL